MAEARVIIDAGPLVAFLVKQEEHHGWVTEQFQKLPAPFLTCDAVLTEAFFLVRKLPNGAARFFSLLNSGLLVSDFSMIAEISALEKLVQRYSNVPMSLTDACLVRLSKLHPRAVLFTLDGDFQIYRRDGRQPIPLLMPHSSG
ncbi:MAG TPA: pilus assembly protein [Verrucomicrobiae bacterium]|nr:pilus assembly protein [Verrucomicrobiae bacterium]